jgi:glyceraldehyde-3-phosphate dehydrogenase (NADP+)
MADTVANTELPPFPEVPLIHGRILIDGEILSSGFERREVRSFSDLKRTMHGSPQGLVLGETPDVDVGLFMRAVDAAVEAWGKGRGDWPTARMEDRIQSVGLFRERMVEQRELVCRLLMWEIGKSWTDAQSEFDRTVKYIDDTIEETKGLDRDSSRFQFAEGIVAQIRRAPLGVTLCMGPFNYPLNETFTTLIPALIMGNTVVVKLPRFGELLWDALLEAFQQSFPRGVVNVVNGQGRKVVGAAMESGKIDVLAFIGTSRVANQIKTSHPRPNRLRSILSLEAKNAAILLPDAELDLTINECVRGALSFNGQRCTALKILFVHRSIAKDFTRRLADKVDALICASPWQKGVQITPLPDPNKPAYLKELIDDAVARGAKLVNPERGGKVEGNLFHPAVLSNVALDARVAQEEQFGPVIPVCEFERLDEVEDYILNSPYGGQASIFGQDPDTVGSLIDRLSNQVCRINLNAQCQRGPDVFPFTGRKDSAEGTLSVYDALRSFSIRTMVATKQDTLGKQVIRNVLDHESSRFLSTNIVL